MSPTAHLGWRLRPLSGCTARPRACRGAPVPPRQTLPSSSVCHRQRPWTSLWDSTGPAPLGGLCPPTQGERAGDGSQHANLPSWLPRKRCLRTEEGPGIRAPSRLQGAGLRELWARSPRPNVAVWGSRAALREECGRAAPSARRLRPRHRPSEPRASLLLLFTDFMMLLKTTKFSHWATFLNT